MGSVSPLPLCLSLSASPSVTDSPTHLRHWGVSQVSLACIILHTLLFYLFPSLRSFSTTSYSPSDFQAPPFFSASLSVYVEDCGEGAVRQQWREPLCVCQEQFDRRSYRMRCSFHSRRKWLNYPRWAARVGQFKLKLRDIVSSSADQVESLSKWTAWHLVVCNFFA